MNLSTPFAFLVSLVASAPIVSDDVVFGYKESGYSLDTTIYWQEEAWAEASSIKVFATAGTR
jgi:hypothetical protein